jgi:predicted peroxiredoxin
MSGGTIIRAWTAGVLVAAAALASVGCASVPERTANATEIPKSGLLINLTSGKDDPHAATMALMFATRSQKAGRPTVVFLNVHAPPLAARDLPDSVGLPGEPPVKKLLAEFMSSGGRVYVCPHCLGVAGMKNEDLVAGVQPMDGEQLLEQLDRGTIALSY